MIVLFTITFFYLLIIQHSLMVFKLNTIIINIFFQYLIKLIEDIITLNITSRYKFQYLIIFNIILIVFICQTL